MAHIISTAIHYNFSGAVKNLYSTLGQRLWACEQAHIALLPPDLGSKIIGQIGDNFACWKELLQLVSDSIYGLSLFAPEQVIIDLVTSDSESEKETGNGPTPTASGQPPIQSQSSRKRQRVSDNSDDKDAGKAPSALRQKTLLTSVLRRWTDPESIKQERERKAEKKKDKIRSQTRERVRKLWERRRETARRKAKQVIIGETGLNCTQLKQALNGVAAQSNIKRTWKTGRTGKRGGVIHNEAYKRINYFTPLLWSHIARIAPWVAFSPSMIVSIPKRDMPQLFHRLSKGTVSKWLSKCDQNRWLKHTLKKVEAKGRLKGTGKVGVLTQYPEVMEEIVKKLEGIRTSGIPLDRVLTRSIMIAIIKHCIPHVLATFKCSKVTLAIQSPPCVTF
ncbi:hypothetical protein NMY22_g19984 [Coprinellus aureogranulatus]|nr:hypothetical protein NMY22_g19984 [Coprinellus aureogranulatus]